MLHEGLLELEHANILAAWLDLEMNGASHWERFHQAWQKSVGVRLKYRLDQHNFTYECCAPEGIEGPSFVRVTGIIVYGTHPVEAEARLQEAIESHPPKRPKTPEEARERDAELTKQRNELYQRMYEGAIG